MASQVAEEPLPASRHPAEKNEVVASFLKKHNFEKVTDSKPSGATPLFVAASALSHENVLDELLLHEDLHYMLRQYSLDRHNNSLTPIHIAAANNDYQVVRKILKVDKTLINFPQKENGATPLVAAAAEGCCAVVEELLSHPECEINATDSDGNSAFLVACMRSHVDVVEYLLYRKGCDVNIVNKHGFTPFLAAVRRGHKFVVHLLLRHPDVNVTAKTTKGFSAAYFLANETLHAAENREARNNYCQVLYMVLCDGRIDFSDAPTMGGEYLVSLLHIAALSSVSAKIVPFLVEKLLINVDTTVRALTVSEDVHLIDVTPLHIAVYANNTDMFKALIHYGADTTIPMVIRDEKRGARSAKRVPLEEVALQKGNTEIAKMLLYLHNAGLHQEFSTEDPIQQTVTTDPVKPILENHVGRKWGISLIPLIKLVSGIASSVVNIIFIFQNFVNLIRVGRKPAEDYDLLKWMMNMTEFLFVVGSLLLLILLLTGLIFIRIIDCCRPNKKSLLDKIPYLTHSSVRVMVLCQLFSFTKLSMAKFYFNMGILSSFLMLFISAWSSTIAEFKERQRFAKVYKGFDKRNVKWLLKHIATNILITVGCTLFFGYIIFIGSVAVLLKLRQMADLVVLFIGKWEFGQYFSFIALLNQLSTTQVIIIPEFQQRFKGVGGNPLHIQNLFYNSIAERALSFKDCSDSILSEVVINFSVSSAVYAAITVLSCCISKLKLRSDLDAAEDIAVNIVLFPIIILRLVIDPLYRLVLYLLFIQYPEQDSMDALTRDIIKHKHIPTKRVVDIYFERHEKANIQQATDTSLSSSTFNVAAEVLGVAKLEKNNSSLRNRINEAQKEKNLLEIVADQV